HRPCTAPLHFALRATGCPGRERAERVREMLTKAALHAVATAYPSQLSGGQRQLFALARAMITQPKVILMDEPLASLDVALRERFIEMLLRLVQEEHLSLLYVTHQQEEAFTLADCMVIMHQGRIEQRGTPQEVYHHPATAFVQAFIGGTNTLEGVVVTSGQVHTACGTIHCETLEIQAGEAVRLCIRAEDLTIDHGGKGEIVGVVARTVPLGGSMLYIDVGGRFLKVRSTDDVQQGQEVMLTMRRRPQCTRLEPSSGAPR